MDFTKQMYLLWFLAIGAVAKHLPPIGDTSEENQRFLSSSSLLTQPKISSLTFEKTLNLELLLENDTSIYFEQPTTAETATENFRTTKENEAYNRSESSPRTLETNSIHKMLTMIDKNEERNGSEPLKRVYLSNESVVCNDGSQAGYYIRKSSTNSPVWIVFLEGGWYCYDKQSCRNRWVRLRHLMTSSQWPETREVSGMLSANPEENPYWYDANHVMIPYCSSDTWSGTTSPTSIGESAFHFMGKLIVLQTIRDLIPIGLKNSTQLIFAGSSAGGTGVMINLDPVQHLLHVDLGLKKIAVRGISDSGWFLDRTPYSPSILPAVDAIKKGHSLWQGSLPKRCSDLYREEPWRCYFGYRLYPTLRAPLFVFQWLFDEAQMTADNVGAPVTPQQWDYIHQMGNALRVSFQGVTALFAPSCVSHSVLTKREWLRVSINDVTVAHAIRCWELATMKKSTRNHLITLSNKPARQLVKSGNNYQYSKSLEGWGFTNHPKKNNSTRNNQLNSNKNLSLENRRRGKKGSHRKRKINNLRQNLDVENGEINGLKIQNANMPLKHSKNSYKIRLEDQKQHVSTIANRKRKTKHANKQKKRKISMQRCSQGNAVSKYNQRLGRAGTLNCDNENIGARRHLHNKNKQSRKLFNPILYPNFQNNTFFDLLSNTFTEEHQNSNTSRQHSRSEKQMRYQRSLMKGTKNVNSGCEHRHIERCSWPQCNHSCPRLLDPYTGEEIHFIDMLKSFGLEMESVAQALGVDMQTLNNMEHGELLDLLTQQSN